MNYGDYVRQVMKLPFVNDEKAADTAIKTVLGVLSSKVGELEARKLTNVLPPELGFGVLVGHQQKPVQYTAEQFVSLVATELDLKWQEAHDLVFRVIHSVKESEEGADMMEEIQRQLPADWGEMVDRA